VKRWLVAFLLMASTAWGLDHYWPNADRQVFQGGIASSRSQLGPTLFANLGTPADGQTTYCPDCTLGSIPCTGAGSGALAVRIVGAWLCGTSSAFMPPGSDTQVLFNDVGTAVGAASGFTFNRLIPDYNATVTAGLTLYPAPAAIGNAFPIPFELLHTLTFNNIGSTLRAVDVSEHGTWSVSANVNGLLTAAGFVLAPTVVNTTTLTEMGEWVGLEHSVELNSLAATTVQTSGSTAVLDAAQCGVSIAGANAGILTCGALSSVVSTASVNSGSGAAALHNRYGLRFNTATGNGQVSHTDGVYVEDQTVQTISFCNGGARNTEKCTTDAVTPATTGCPGATCPGCCLSANGQATAVNCNLTASGTTKWCSYNAGGAPSLLNGTNYGSVSTGGNLTFRRSANTVPGYGNVQFDPGFGSIGAGIVTELTVGAGASELDATTSGVIGLDVGKGATWTVSANLIDSFGAGGEAVVYEPLVTNTATITDLGLHLGLKYSPTFKADGGGVTGTLPTSRSVQHIPVYTIANAGTLVVTDDSGLVSAPKIDTGATVTTRRGVWMQNKVGSGVQTNVIGVDIAAQTVGTGAIGVQSAIAAGASNYAFRDTGGAQSVLAGSLAIGGGTAILKHLSAAASLTFGGTTAGTCELRTLTVTGAADADTVACGLPAALAASDNYQTFYCYVSAANTVTVKRCNLNAVSALAAVTSTVRADVWQH
jgi:hypothetical protein